MFSHVSNFFWEGLKCHYQTNRELFSKRSVNPYRSAVSNAADQERPRCKTKCLDLCRRLGCFDLNPGPGVPTIGRNYGRGPAMVNLSLRLARTWSFGNRGESGLANPGACLPDGVRPAEILPWVRRPATALRRIAANTEAWPGRSFRHAVNVQSQDRYSVAISVLEEVCRLS